MGDKLNVFMFDASLQKLASNFYSGNTYLDRFLRENISLDEDFGKTYVFLTDAQDTIIGYYNIGVGDIEQENFGVSQKIGGAVHINCFALDEKYHGLMQNVYRCICQCRLCELERI